MAVERNRFEFQDDSGNVLMFRPVVAALAQRTDLSVRPQLGQAPIFRGDLRVKIVQTDTAIFREIGFDFQSCSSEAQVRTGNRPLCEAA